MARPDPLPLPITAIVARLAIHLVILAGLPIDLPIGVARAEDPAPPPNFQRDVLPILQSHCVRCHGPKAQESELRLDTLSTDLIRDRAAADRWNHVLHALNAGEMPPPDEPQLPTAQREVVTRWARHAVDRAVKARQKTDGRGALRRLNRFEYQQTMTDLLGLEMDYAKDLPPDPASPDGFRNNGQTLQMSALQLEAYLNTARQALDRVIVTGEEPTVHDHTFAESNARGWLGGVERANLLGRKQVFLGVMPQDYPEEGAFRIRVTLSAQVKPDHDYPRLEVSLGYRPDTKILFRTIETVEITDEAEQTLEFFGRVENHPLPVRGQGKFPGLVVRLRNVFDDGSPLPPKVKAKDVKNPKQKKRNGEQYAAEPHFPTIEIHSVQFTAPFFQQWPPAEHQRILPDPATVEGDHWWNDEPYVRAVLSQFLRRAYRRPMLSDAPEVTLLTRFYQRIRPDFPTFESAIRETLAFALIRPEFLYLFEPSDTEKRRLTDAELAARMSYFLWGTMPDESLLRLAERGELRSGNALATEVERLLDAPRSSRFVQQFVDQWLHLDVVDRVAVSRSRHPNFDELLKGDMQGETREFFHYLLKHDASALHLLDSDFTMLNGPLARHYGIANVRGREFRRVELTPEDRRGGLLGHASILLANSTGEDSHAVRRAVWIRDRLLGDPPAPPPPNAPSLEEADPKFHELSIREQLEVHRTADGCQKCHRDIDPWGIALENYDAIGLWRDEIVTKKGKREQRAPVQASDTLPDGTELDGAQRLRDYLRTDRKDQFARALTARLLGYATGRRLELTDEPEVTRLTNAFRESHYHLRELVHAVVQSDTFQSK